jgi:hypothetical protein
MVVFIVSAFTVSIGQLPRAPAPRPVVPGVLMTFIPGDQKYHVSLLVRTAVGGGRVYRGVTVEQASATAARDLLHIDLEEAGYVVESVGKETLIIRGHKKPDGSTDPVASVQLRVADLRTQMPVLTGLGGAKVLPTE